MNNRLLPYLLSLTWIALILNGCKSEENNLNIELKAVDKVIFIPISGQATGPVEFTDTATLRKLTLIPSGEKSPVMKCGEDAVLKLLSGPDTVLSISLTLQEGCMTASFVEGGELKSVWLNADVSSLLKGSMQKSMQLSDLKKLEWMLGKWTQTDPDGSISFETWSIADANSFAGHSYTLQGKDTVFQESLQLKVEGEQIFYVATVQENAGPVKFRMTESGPDFATFENKAHDFPQIITYVAKGDSGLVASISGTKNGQFGRSEFPLKRVSE